MSMNCETMHEMILIYADCPDEIADLTLKTEYSRHLDECASCRAFRSEILQTIQLVKDCAPEVPLRDGKTISDSVLDTLNNPKELNFSRKRSFFRSHFGTIAAVFIVAIVLAVTNNDTFRTIFDRTFLAEKSELKDSAVPESQVYSTYGTTITAPDQNIETADNSKGIQAKTDADTGAFTKATPTAKQQPKIATGAGSADNKTANGTSKANEKGNDSSVSSNPLQNDTDPSMKNTEDGAPAQEQPSPAAGNTGLQDPLKRVEPSNDTTTDDVQPQDPKGSEPSIAAKSVPSGETTSPSGDTNVGGMDIEIQTTDTTIPKVASAPGFAAFPNLPPDTNLFSDYVTSCNQTAIAVCTHTDKDRHNISFELASQVSLEDFQAWFASLTDLETEYTVDNFKKKFGLA